MGSNIIVIATLIFLLFSAVVLVLMLCSMKRKTPSIHAIPATPTPHQSAPTYVSLKKTGISLHKPAFVDVTGSLNDIQDFINAKAEIIYNERAYALDSDFYKIGRDLDCNLIISDESVSRLQCAIEYHDNIFMLSDLNSKYGTYVNGEQAARAVELHDGDEIRMGYAVMTFKRRNERKTNDSGAENPSQRTD